MYQIRDHNTPLGRSDASTLSPNAFYDNIALVPQRSKILKGTVLYNLKFGNPNASMEVVAQYCTLTGFDLILTRLDLGYETMLGESEQTLSGGELQLLSLTRACIRETPILILDEPTSSLDPDSEKKIKDALLKIAQNRTLIIASHREAMIAICDQKLILGGEQHV